MLQRTKNKLNFTSKRSTTYIIYGTKNDDKRKELTINKPIKPVDFGFPICRKKKIDADFIPFTTCWLLDLQSQIDCHSVYKFCFKLLQPFNLR